MLCNDKQENGILPWVAWPMPILIRNWAVSYMIYICPRFEYSIIIDNLAGFYSSVNLLDDTYGINSVISYRRLCKDESTIARAPDVGVDEEEPPHHHSSKVALDFLPISPPAGSCSGPLT